ncbi:hypothetical protein [Chromobacterium piscinae]|uniref:hypothetical protein n=1 Tax=Chromobacterium piscinae TaxID=686831 RepID=UPI00326040B5
MRAHLALSYFQSAPPDFPRVLELSCYVESAWVGASRSFQSPPKALGPARALLTDLLQALEGNGMAAPEQVLDPPPGRSCRTACCVLIASGRDCRHWFWSMPWLAYGGVAAR